MITQKEQQFIDNCLSGDFLGIKEFCNEVIKNLKLESSKEIIMKGAEKVVIKEHIEIFRYLRKNILSQKEEESLLYLACQCNKMKIAKIILESNDKIKNSISNRKCLRFAIENNNEELVNLLIKKGIEFRENYEELLRETVNSGKNSLSQLLIEEGADYSIYDNTLVRTWAINKNYEMLNFIFHRENNIQKLISVIELSADVEVADWCYKYKQSKEMLQNLTLELSSNKDMPKIKL